ncbi:hypothetical protein [Alicyclobacillus sp. SO9]|uniref:hypothetical protein n=1 Tax=Alicyclobacillus sp. SO9 TaxID=2665646 RepID=UPI0018E768A9|nr:hypothetical protein [Alicyclobacillus sp. SO9]QQE78155.1 hypothetical protein GI364_20065 [Alicyclobacillus sp. SO9]
MAIAYTLFEHVFQNMSHCIYAEQVFCSLTTEMKYLPAFKDNPHLQALHKENYETSYHQNTAAGNLQRLMVGAKTREQEKVLVVVAARCMLEAKKHQAKADEALKTISVPQEHVAWLDASRHWQHMRHRWLKLAMKDLRSAVPPKWWSEAEAMNLS